MVSTLHRGHSWGLSTGRLAHILRRLCILHLSLSILTAALRRICYRVIWGHAVLGICRVNSCILHGSLSLYLLTTTRCCAQHKFWIRTLEFWENRKVEIGGSRSNCFISLKRKLFLPCISAAWLCVSWPGYGGRFVPLWGLTATFGYVWAAS